MAGDMIWRPKSHDKRPLWRPTSDDGETFNNSSTMTSSVLGIYMPHKRRGQAHGAFGEQTQMMKDMTRLGHAQGLDVVVLTPGYSSSRRGWRYDLQQNVWKEVAVEIPSIVLRRTAKYAVSNVLVRNDLNLFMKAGSLHTLPRACSNKWMIYQLIRQSPGMKETVPYTTLVSSWDQLYRQILRRPNVYLKPLAGSQGRSIYHLTLQKNHIAATYERQSFTNQGGQLHRTLRTTLTEELTLNSTEDIQAFWREIGLRRCIVQDAVPPPRTQEGRPFDFRWLVQSCPTPTVFARVARVGRVEAVTTNIHTGAEAKDADELLATVYGSASQKILQELDQTALRVVQLLRKRYGSFAELGVDLTVDPRGQVKVFEVNPTPGRRMLRALGGDVRQMSLNCLIEYAKRAISANGD